MDLKGKRVMVLGLARTGCETARFLVDRGAEVVVSDCRRKEELHSSMESLAGIPVRYLLGGNDPRWVEDIEALIPSPGVPADNPMLRQARKIGIEILSEIELAYRFLKVPLVAITGTNGKTTTTTLIGKMFDAARIRSFVGGNIGFPLIALVSKDWQWGVVEVSSFQLEWVEQFRPKIAVLLNLTEDHLDRYPDFASYAEAKGRIFSAQTKQDLAVLNRDDPTVWALREKIHARVVSFGWGEVEIGVFATADHLVWRGEEGEERFPLTGVPIRGIHNVENLMAVVAVGKSIGVSSEVIQKVMEEFHGLEHRHEFVREKDGVRFYNDSKGTNVGAVLKALASFSSPVILICGGVDKGGDYGVLGDEVKARVKKLVIFGAAKQTIEKALGRFTETVVVDNLEAGFLEAHRSAVAGDVVLLSPACSSFDMFHNYAERGEAFKALVHGL